MHTTLENVVQRVCMPRDLLPLQSEDAGNCDMRQPHSADTTPLFSLRKIKIMSVMVGFEVSLLFLKQSGRWQEPG